MRFEFEVGLRERHRVEFSFNQALGPLRITVDGEPVVRSFRMFSLHLTKRFAFRVGQEEIHEVAIDKTKARFFGGLRPQTCRVFVDGEVFGEYPGFGSSLTIPAVR